MKKIIRKYIGLSAVLCLALTSCGNTLNETSTPVLETVETIDNSDETNSIITITGKIDPTGAAPRSATSSFNQTITWIINAISTDYSFANTADGTSKITQGATASSVSTDKSFSLSLAQTGNWTITVHGFSGDYTNSEIPAGTAALFTGETEINVPEQGLSNLKISVSLQQTGSTATGTVSLPMSAPSNIKKVTALLTEYQSENTKTKEAVFENGRTSLFIEDIPAGSYTANLSFEDEIGNTLYTCNEALTVYAGQETNTWFGTAPYLVNAEGTIKFTLTQALIDSYDADIVPSTNSLMYDYKYDEEESDYLYNYYFMDDYKNELPATTELTTLYNSFAIDADGYYYVISKMLDSATYIKSNKPDFGAETADNTVEPGAMYLYGDQGNHLLVDRKTGFLYLIDKSNGAAITRITKEDGTYDYNSDDLVYYPDKTFSLSESSENRSVVLNSTGYTIYDGFCYFVNMDDDKLQIAVVDLNKPDNSGYLYVSNMFEIPVTNVSTYSSSISDVIYMDGELCILLKDYNPDGALKSHGMLIKCNTITGAYKTVGFAPEKKLMSYKAGVYYNDNVNHFSSFLYNSEDVSKSDYYIADFSIENEEDQLVIQAPFNNLDSYFVGPQKFVAIKPKKLVISDTGIAFYTDTDGAVYYKDVNRIVEVDLKTLSISSSTDVDVAFDTPHENNGLPLSGLPSVTTSSEFHIWNSASGRWDSVSAGTTLQCGFIKKQ